MRAHVSSGPRMRRSRVPSIAGTPAGMFAQRLTQSKREGGVRNPVPPSPSLLLPSSASLRLLAVAATSSDSLYTRVDTADTIESNIWGFLAVSALCGTVTGSVMFLKTGNPKYVWVCAGLPVMALLAGAMRERARQEAQRDQIILLISDLRKELFAVRSASGAAAAAATAASTGGTSALVNDMRELVRYVDSSRGLLQRVEGKVTALEGAVASAGRNAQEASVAATRLRQESGGSLDGVVAALRRELASLQLQAPTGGAQDVAVSSAVARLEGRLGALEAAISGLETSQTESLRRFSSSFASALTDPSGALQSNLRMEVSRALEPVRDAYALASPGAAASGVPIPGPWLQRETEVELTERERARLREVVKDEVQRGVGQVLSEQEQALREVAAQPVTLGPEQWSALGNRLRGIERVVNALPEEQKKVLEAWSQSGSLSESLRSVQETILTLQSAAAREAPKQEDAGAAAAIVDAEVLLKEGLDDVALKLQELQRAADARDAMLQQVLAQLSQRMAAGTAAGSAPGVPFATVPAPGVASGSEAVAALVRDFVSEAPRALPQQSAQPAFQQFITGAESDAAFAATQREIQELVAAGAAGRLRSDAPAAMDPPRSAPPPPSSAAASAAPPAPVDRSRVPEPLAPPPPAAAPFASAPVAEQPLAAPATPHVPANPKPASLLAAEAQQQLQQQQQQPEPQPAAVGAPSSSFLSMLFPMMGGRPVTSADLEKGMKKALGLLKSGREQARTGELAAAEQTLKDARAIFEKITEYDAASVQALGNLGNTLLALGQLRVQQAEGLAAAGAGARADATDPSMPVAQLEDEAANYLVQAGRRFRQAYEANLKEVRALCNWGQALSIRAKLAAKEDAERAAELYEASIEKFQAVLAAEPATMPALRLLAVALREYGLLSNEGSMERAECLESALDVVARAIELDAEDETLRRLEDDLQDRLESCLRILSRG